jgi:hypothetical protein
LPSFKISVTELKGIRSVKTSLNARQQSGNERGEWMEIVIRFLVGGLVVSLFALSGDVLKPKSFAGIFGAAPSVALATLGLTIGANGKRYAALEARSMIVGALAFLIYACACRSLLARGGAGAKLVATALLGLWIACALAGFAILR